MPEGPELRLMSKYINQHQNKKFTEIKKSSVHRDTLPEYPSNNFSLSATSRGKEIQLEITDNTQQLDPIYLFFTMGMSGNWFFTSVENLKKHSHLMFVTSNSNYLSFVDPRRFGRWRLGIKNGWKENRGPDIIDDYNNFKSNLHNNSHRKILNKPIYELLMDQKYFNGIGNYLRAEILYHWDQNPFQSAKTAIQDNKLLELCRSLQLESYALGGGELRTFIDPNQEYKKSTFRDWLQCYEKLTAIRDSKKRNFWFHPKWN